MNEQSSNSKIEQQLKVFKVVLPSNGVLFNTAHPIECMFYTDVLAAYSFPPDHVTIQKLSKLGYRIYLMDG